MREQIKAYLIKEWAFIGLDMDGYSRLANGVADLLLQPQEQPQEVCEECEGHGEISKRDGQQRIFEITCPSSEKQKD